MAKRRTTPTTETRLRELAADGLTVSEIATATGIHPSSIGTTLSVLGIQCASARKPVPDLSPVVAKLAENIPVSRIAKEMGITANTLYVRLRRAGLPTSRTQAMQAMLAALKPPTP